MGVPSGSADTVLDVRNRPNPERSITSWLVAGRGQQGEPVPQLVVGVEEAETITEVHDQHLVRGGPRSFVGVVLSPIIAQPRVRRRPTVLLIDNELGESVDLALAP